MQQSGKEEPKNFFPALREIYKNKYGLATQGNSLKCKVYDMHDEKMGYALTQHALWNRKHTPFLLCKRKSGDAVRNADHIFRLINHDEYLSLNNRSSKQWHRKTRERKVKGKQYDLDTHHAWIDQHNHGIFHFGIDPNHLRLDNLRFDFFHLTCPITRRLLSALRTFLFKQSCEVMDRFVKLLSNFWGSYNLDVWKQDKEFSSFIGLEIIQFMNKIHLVTVFLVDNFKPNEYVDSKITGLNLWVDLCKFIHTTTIDDENDYKNKMDTFKSTLKLFFTAGGKSFLTKGTVAGNDKAFYMHCLRCYVPKKIARKTFKDHHLGVGVFTIDYERRNEEKTSACPPLQWKG